MIFKNALDPAQTDHDYCDAPNIVVLSEYKSAAISYIACRVLRFSDVAKLDK
jgi:hypothetical protein